MKKFKNMEYRMMLNKSVAANLITAEEKAEIIDKNFPILINKDAFNEKVVERIRNHKINDVHTIIDKLAGFFSANDLWRRAIIEQFIQDELEKSFDHKDRDGYIYYTIGGFTYHGIEDATIKILLGIIAEQGLLEYFDNNPSSKYAKLLGLGTKEELRLRFDCDREEVEAIASIVAMCDISYDGDLNAIDTAYIIGHYFKDIEAEKLSVYKDAERVERLFDALEIGLESPHGGLWEDLAQSSLEELLR